MDGLSAKFYTVITYIVLLLEYSLSSPLLKQLQQEHIVKIIQIVIQSQRKLNQSGIMLQTMVL